MEYYKLLFYYLSYSCPNGSLVYQFCPFYIKKWKPKRPPQKTKNPDLLASQFRVHSNFFVKHI